MSATLLLVPAIACLAAGIASYFVARWWGQRHPITLGSPPCDRCGKDTGKPWLWRQKGTPWRCTECDQWLTNQLFPDMDSPDYDRTEHAAFLRAYNEMQQRPTA